MKSIFPAIKVYALAIVLSFGLSYALAWTAPTSQPPVGNVSAPINTGATAQTKTGPLTILGGITVGTNTASCDTTTKGSIRYSNTSNILEYCNATTWKSIADVISSPAFTSFTAPTVARTGTAFNLSWVTVDAVSCLAGGSWTGLKPVSGSQSITETIASLKTYNLDCTNASGTANGSVSVDVLLSIGTMTTYTGTGAAPSGIAFDGTNMWTANPRGYSVTKITPTGSVTTYTYPYSGIDTSPNSIAFDGTNMWTANYAGHSVTKITPTGSVTTYTGTGARPFDIAFDGTNMWTANYYGNSVTKITPTGSMTTYAGTGAAPFGIAFDGTNMWTANYSGNSVTKITPTGSMTTYTGTGAAPFGIAFDGTNMWTANYSGSSVTKIQAI